MNFIKTPVRRYQLPTDASLEILRPWIGSKIRVHTQGKAGASSDEHSTHHVAVDVFEGIGVVGIGCHNHDFMWADIEAIYESSGLMIYIGTE